MVFGVFQCPCGEWTVREIRKSLYVSLKCNYCRKSTVIKDKSHYGLNVKDGGFYATPKEASDHCRVLKAKHGGLEY